MTVSDQRNHTTSHLNKYGNYQAPVRELIIAHGNLELTIWVFGTADGFVANISATTSIGGFYGPSTSKETHYSSETEAILAAIAKFRKRAEYYILFRECLTTLKQHLAAERQQSLF
ncbi:MAG: hypothetical protein ACK52I_14865 [Pseudomonadota bacterium]|jgi:hypothetical protein